MSSPAQRAAQRALRQAERGNLPAAWRLLDPHRDAATTDAEYAWAWLVIANAAQVGHRHRHRIAAIMAAFPTDAEVAAFGAEILLDDLASRPHDEDPLADDDQATLALQGLAPALDATREPGLLMLKGAALRRLGPERAAEAVAVLQEAIAAAPHQTGWQYELGLALKAAGQFRAAISAFEAYDAAGDDDEVEEGVLWNLGICATGAGLGPLALRCWEGLGRTDSRFGPDGLPQVPALLDVRLRVRIAPQLYTYVLAAPQSPCHGRLLGPAGAVPAGARVLWDTTPVFTDGEEDDDLPCMPLLGPL